jgi:hypothetical protein
MSIESALQEATRSLEEAVIKARGGTNNTYPSAALPSSAPSVTAEYDPDNLAAAFFAKGAMKAEKDDVQEWAKLIVLLESRDSEYVKKAAEVVSERPRGSH